eukprot:COSAG02_NODE_44_length_45948_cov_81.673493_17_plen_144_part_00
MRLEIPSFSPRGERRPASPRSPAASRARACPAEYRRRIWPRAAASRSLCRARTHSATASEPLIPAFASTEQPRFRPHQQQGRQDEQPSYNVDCIPEMLRHPHQLHNTPPEEGLWLDAIHVVHVPAVSSPRPSAQRVVAADLCQ